MGHVVMDKNQRKKYDELFDQMVDLTPLEMLKFMDKQGPVIGYQMIIDLQTNHNNKVIYRLWKKLDKALKADIRSKVQNGLATNWNVMVQAGKQAYEEFTSPITGQLAADLVNNMLNQRMTMVDFYMRAIAQLVGIDDFTRVEDLAKQLIDEHNEKAKSSGKS